MSTPASQLSLNLSGRYIAAIRQLPCVSLQWPWWDLVRRGLKTIEARSWKLLHHGPLGIASVKGQEHTGRPPEEHGALVAIVWLENCRPFGFGANDFDRAFPPEIRQAPDMDKLCNTILGQLGLSPWAWVFRPGSAVPIEPPIPVRGRQGLFYLDADEEIRPHLEHLNITIQGI